MMRIALVILLLFQLALASDKIVLKKPPESLKKYYPPESKEFSFLKNMHGMSVAFSGINLNINEERWDRALKWAKRLKEIYIKTSQMVPEWEDYYKPELADKLVEAVKSRNVDSVIRASKELGKTCTRCHRDNEIAVKLVYRFPSFETVEIEDPVDFEKYETGKYMKKLTDSLKALIVFLEDGDVEKVQEHGINFVERSRQLKTMCSKCHTKKISEEAIFGKMFDDHLNLLENLISEQNIDKKKVMNLLGAVETSCSKCHNVHLVPALVRETFEE